MQAQYRGDEETVQRLRQEGQPLDVWEAAAVGDAVLLAHLLDTEPSLANAWSQDGAQPLHFASFFGREEAVRVLLDRGADANAHARGFNGVTPMNSAAANDMKSTEACTRIARLLLAHGADPHAKQNGGSTALDVARLTRNAELEALLTNKPETE